MVTLGCRAFQPLVMFDVNLQNISIKEARLNIRFSAFRIQPVIHLPAFAFLKQYSLLIADLAFVIESLIPGLFFFAQAAGLLLSSLDEESKQRNQAKIITYQPNSPVK